MSNVTERISIFICVVVCFALLGCGKLRKVTERVEAMAPICESELEGTFIPINIADKVSVNTRVTFALQVTGCSGHYRVLDMAFGNEAILLYKTYSTPKHVEESVVVSDALFQKNLTVKAPAFDVISSGIDVTPSLGCNVTVDSDTKQSSSSAASFMFSVYGVQGNPVRIARILDLTLQPPVLLRSYPTSLQTEHQFPLVLSLYGQHTVVFEVTDDLSRRAVCFAVVRIESPTSQPTVTPTPTSAPVPTPTPTPMPQPPPETENGSEMDNIAFHAAFDDSNWLTDFNNPGIIGKQHTRIVTDPQKNKPVLEITYPQGQIGGPSGLMFNSKVGSYEQATLSYWIRFAPDFNFVRGGKLPGLCGGSCPGVEYPTGTDGWTSRLMWREGGVIENLLTHVGQKSIYGDDLGWFINGQRAKFQPGKWHHLELEFVMNDSGKSNGIIRSWLDGQLALDLKNVKFRTVSSVKITTLCFSTFFGGNEMSWAPKKPERIFFDDFMITH